MMHLVIPAVMAVFVYGLWIAMEEGQALHWLRRILQRVVTHPTLSKPVHACMQCMVSVWGTLACVALGMVTMENALLLPLYLIIAVGIINRIA